jgi:hypothetical protein
VERLKHVLQNLFGRCHGRNVRGDGRAKAV